MTMLVAVTVNVEAENAEAAEKLAMEKTGNEEAYYLSHYDSVWEREVIEVNECDPEEDDGMTEALEYVRENMSETEMQEVKLAVSKAYEHHLTPSAFYNVDDKVIDLLEEYGEDNDLPEGWWENEGDIDDWLLKL